MKAYRFVIRKMQCNAGLLGGGTEGKKERGALDDLKREEFCIVSFHLKAIFTIGIRRRSITKIYFQNFLLGAWSWGHFDHNSVGSQPVAAPLCPFLIARMKIIIFFASGIF